MTQIMGIFMLILVYNAPGLRRHKCDMTQTPLNESNMDFIMCSYHPLDEFKKIPFFTLVSFRSDTKH